MAKGLYKGYSSHEYQPHKTFNIQDIELVKLDLLNHIFTRKGERVMMPAFGTRIPDLPFEPLDPITLSILEEDLRFVFNFDPRVELMSLVIDPQYDANAVSAAAKLLYVELNMIDTLDLNITFESS